jgi:flagellar biosynthesis protein FlhB
VSDAQDRTLPATPARRARAIAGGGRPTVAGPAGLASVAALLAVLALGLPAMVREAAALARHSWRAEPVDSARRTHAPPRGGLAAASPAPSDSPGSAAWLAILLVGTLAIPTAVGIGVQIIVDRPGFRPSLVAPALSRINPAAGLRRLAGGAWGRMFSSLATVIVAGAAGVRALGDLGGLFSTLEPIPASTAMTAGLRAAGLVLAVCMALAVARFAWSRRRFERSIRMTPREFEEERRRLEPAAAVDWQRDRGPGSQRSPTAPPRTGVRDRHPHDAAATAS